MTTHKSTSDLVLSRRTLLVNGAAMAAVSRLPASVIQREETMTVAAETQESSKQAGGDQSIRPFKKFVASQAALDELRRRIKDTQWPEKETVSDSSQGVPLATMKELGNYWATGHDWRKAE